MNMRTKLFNRAWLKNYAGPNIVLVTGCFDVMHVGHVILMEHAKLLRPGGQVWVGINSDAAVARLKGPGRPVNTYEHRALVMASLMFVDHVFEIDSDRVTNAILALRPMAWVKGGDYTMDTLDKGEVAAAKVVGAEIVLFRSGYDISTSKILNQSQ